MYSSKNFYSIVCMVMGTACMCAQEVVFITPVVNLCSEKLSTYGPVTQELYDEQPFSGFDGAYDCMRTAQALFNEVGTVIAWDPQTHELCVELHHFIVDAHGVKKFPQFWCWDAHVIKKKILKKSFVKGCNDYNYLILRQPFFDKNRDVVYSAGTKFVRVPEKDSEQGYGIQLFAPELKKNITRVVPRSSVVIPDDSLSCRERRLACRDLIRSWINNNDDGSEIIPYVWGGASFIHRTSDDSFKKQEGLFLGHTTHFWERPCCSVKQAYGFDCSSLIVRAAHIVGIPYYYKTSHAAFILGTVLKDIDEISEGDLIVWPGHMVMISDLKKGLLIESKGYNAGFGKVQEVHLSRRFKGISSYQDLFKTYLSGLYLQELDSAGNVVKTIPEFKIISLCG